MTGHRTSLHRFSGPHLSNAAVSHARGSTIRDRDHTLLGLGGWAFRDTYKLPFGTQLAVLPEHGGTIKLKPGPGAYLADLDSGRTMGSADGPARTAGRPGCLRWPSDGCGLFVERLAAKSQYNQCHRCDPPRYLCRSRFGSEGAGLS